MSEETHVLLNAFEEKEVLIDQFLAKDDSGEHVISAADFEEIGVHLANLTEAYAIAAQFRDGKTQGH